MTTSATEGLVTASEVLRLSDSDDKYGVILELYEKYVEKDGKINKEKKQLLSDEVQAVLSPLDPFEVAGTEELTWAKKARDLLWTEEDRQVASLVPHLQESLEREPNFPKAPTDLWDVSIHWPTYMEAIRETLLPDNIPGELLKKGKEVFKQFSGTEMPEIPGAAIEKTGSSRDEHAIDEFPVTAQAILGHVINKILDENKVLKMERKMSKTQCKALEDFREELIKVKNNHLISPPKRYMTEEPEQKE